MIKDNDGRRITDSREVWRICATYFKELLNGKGATRCLELPSSVRRGGRGADIGQEEVESAVHKMKKARRQGQMMCI